MIRLMMRRMAIAASLLIGQNQDYLASAVGWWSAPAYAKELPLND